MTTLVALDVTLAAGGAAGGGGDDDDDVEGAYAPPSARTFSLDALVVTKPRKSKRR